MNKKEKTPTIEHSNLSDDFLNTVLNDYHNCGNVQCEKCLASLKILPSGQTSFCEFLLSHRKYIENKFTEIIDNAL